MPPARRGIASTRMPSADVTPEELADAFGRAAKILGARLAERLAHHGLSVPRANVLVQLARHGPMRVTELGHRVGISQGTASTLTDALTREGLVERRSDPSDGRATRIAANADGRAKAQAWLEDYRRAADELFAPISDQARPEFLALLRVLVSDADETADTPPTTRAPAGSS